MSEFDKTKKAIGLNSMDDSSRKDMLDKFKSAGGQIIKEKKVEEESAKKNRPAPKIIQGQVSRNEFDRSGGGSGGRGGNSRSGSKRKDSSTDSSSSTASAQAAYEKELSSFPNRFAIKLKCWFARVTPFGSSLVTPAMMGIFARDLKAALMEMKLAGNELLTNANHSPKITQALDKVNPAIIELLAMGHKLYDDSELSDLIQPYQAAPDQYVAIERIKQPLYSIFKKLYILYPYQDTYRKGVALAYEHLQKLEGKPAMIYNSRKKKLLNEFEGLFGTIFEKMYLLVIRAENKNIPMVSRYMETVLGIEQDDKPGKRHAGENVENNETTEESAQQEKEDAEKKEAEKKEEEVSIPKEVAYGLKLMKIYNIAQLRKKFDIRGEYSSIPDSDKALLAYLFFKEFDDNYSFVMTTKKIDLKQVHVNGKRVDYRQSLLDQYETSRATMDQFRIYLDTFKEYAEHKANPGSNYIEASKKTTALETKRSQHSRNVRVTAKEFMEKTSDILLILINDMKSKREIVGNMDEPIVFDSMEAKKRLNKKPIRNCIMESYCFSKALAERLENGDIYGGVVELSPEEMKESFGIETPNESESMEEKRKEVDSSLDEPPITDDSGLAEATVDEPLKPPPAGGDDMDSDSMGVDY
ncbi:MAG: hypothetical protein JJT78_07280 [Leptospira sp.]|nr:hypothetical protein [Leptospira sp.]